MAGRKRQTKPTVSSSGNAQGVKLKSSSPSSSETSSSKTSIGIVFVLVAGVLAVSYYFYVPGTTEHGSTSSESRSQQTAHGGEPRPTQSESKNAKSSKDSSRILQLPIEQGDPDVAFAEKIKSGDNLLKKGQYDQALLVFDFVLKALPNSPRAQYGKAASLDGLAVQRKSNQFLDDCIQYYKKVGLESPQASPALQKIALERLADRAQFRGNGKLSVKAFQRLYHELQPDSQEAARTLGVAYLTDGQYAAGKQHFEEVVKKWPDDNFSKAHIGFVLYNAKQYEQSVPHLLDGVYHDPEIRKIPKFFVYAGDSLLKMYKSEEARNVYQEAVNLGLFPSIWQRSTYNEPNLRALPFWIPQQTGQASLVKKLESNWEVIRKEGLALLDVKSGGFVQEDEDLRESGQWNQFTLFARGRKEEKNCKKTPATCALVDAFPAASACRRGQVKFSVMYPGTHVWPHTGPTNCRLRMHLGLVIPDGVAIRVAEERRVWVEGEVLVIDDSLEHEVWHNGTRARLILIVDVWHPDIPVARRAELSPI